MLSFLLSLVFENSFAIRLAFSHRSKSKNQLKALKDAKKDSEKLEKSLCVRDKPEVLCWMPVVFGPSDDTASLISMILSLTLLNQEYFQKPLSVNTIHRAICRCQLKLYHAKRKPYVNMVQKCRRVLWAKAHLKWTVSKWKSVLWSDESKFDILVGNHGCRVLRAKEEGDLPACYQRSVQKPASLLVWGCISAYGMGSLHVLEGTMNAERYIKVLEQHMLPSRRRLFQGRPCVFHQDNAKPHTAAITTA